MGALSRRKAYPVRFLSYLAVAVLLCEPLSRSLAEEVTFGPNMKLDTGLDPVIQREPSIAVSPADPSNLVLGFIDGEASEFPQVCRIFFSRDGGTTWRGAGSTPLGGADHQCYDPALAADAAGSFYFAYLGATGLSLEIRVARSNDSGRTFPALSIPFAGSDFIAFPDKPYIAVDTGAASPFRGTVYLSWTLFGPRMTDTHIQVQVSRDRGATWSNRIRLSPQMKRNSSIKVQFSIPAVAPNGTVYVFYAEYNATKGTMSIKFVRSLDGGTTWSAPANVATGLRSPGDFVLNNADPLFGQEPDFGILANSNPVAAIAPDGTIYVAWVDFPAGSCTHFKTTGVPRNACVNADVRLTVSRNGGATWSAPVKVSDDADANDQWMPWIAVHGDGLLSLIWSDKRLDPANENFDLYYTNTRDGVSFLPNVRVSAATSIVGDNNAPSDYNNLAVSFDRVFPVWNDMSLGENVDVFTAVGTVSRP